MKELTKQDIEEIREKPWKFRRWSLISSSNYILSEDFIREFKDYVDWYLISRQQNLSENFILEFSNEVDWYGISYNQKLSDEFIINNLNNLSFVGLFRNLRVSQETKDYIRMFI